jgi:hypothetical protein
MADIKFSQLPNLGNVTAATIVPVVASGQNFSVTGANLQTFINNSTGNITGGNIVATTAVIGNGSQLTNLPAANIVGTVANATYATSAGTATTATSATTATTAGTVTTAAQANITSVGTLTALTVTGNITGGNINTAGNVQGTYIKGDGSLLTGLPATYANANVTTLLASFGSNTISTTGNITGGNIIATKLFGDGSALTGISANAVLQGNMSGNIAGNSYGLSNMAFVNSTGNIDGNNLTATGNIQGAFVKGNGSVLTGIVTSIVAGAGISVSSATGAVTITNTGGGSGGNSISNGTSSVSIPSSGGNISFTASGLTDQLKIAGIRGPGSTGLQANTGLFLNTDCPLIVYGNVSLGLGSGTSVVMNAPLSVPSSITTLSTLSVGGTATFNSNVTLNGTRLTIESTGSLVIPQSTKTGTSAGVAGQISVDANYLYVCTSTNVWKRAALSSF